MKDGEGVRLSKKFISENINSEYCGDHIKEFMNCVGVIIPKKDTDIDLEDDDRRVMWLPSKLKYSYHVDMLEKIN